MSVEYIMGLMLGFIVAIVLVFAFRKKMLGREKPQYDERQLAEQGRAAKIAYYTLMSYIIIYGALLSVMEITIASPLVVIFAGVLLSIVVYALVCIKNEAYFPINQSASRWLYFLDIIGIINIAIFIINALAEGGILEADGSISTYIVNLLCGMVLLALSLVCRISMKKAKEVDDEELEA